MICKNIKEIAGSARQEEGRQAEIGEKANESEEVFRVQFSVGPPRGRYGWTGPGARPRACVTRRGWWKSASSLRQLRGRGSGSYLFCLRQTNGRAPYSKAVEDSRSPRPGGIIGRQGMADTTFEKQTLWQRKIMSKIRSDSIWSRLGPERPVNDFAVMMELGLQRLATKSQDGSQLNAPLYACCRIFFEGSCLCGIGGGI